MSKLIHTLPELPQTDFNSSTDYLIVQKENGQTYKCRGSIFTGKFKGGLRFLDSPQQIGAAGVHTSGISYTSTELSLNDSSGISINDFQPKTALLSVRSDHGGYPYTVFYYYSSSQNSEDYMHTVRIQHQGTSQHLHEQVFVPVIDGKIYWKLTQRNRGDCRSWVYWHGFIE